MIEQVTIKNKISALDEVIYSYGAIDYLFHFLSLNNELDVNGEILAGEQILTDDFILPTIQFKNNKTTIASKNKLLLKNKITVLNETISQYGNIEALFHFIFLNNNFEILDEIPADTEINIDDFSTPQPISFKKTINIIPENILTTGSELQNIFDISIRYFGDIGQVFNLIQKNPTLNNINLNVTGKNIFINNINNNQTNVKYFNFNNSLLTTGIFTKTKKRAFNRSFNFSFN